MVLAVGRHARIPRRYRGRDVFAWLHAAGQLETQAADVPDLAAAYEEGQLDADGFKAVQSAMVSHCESRQDRMAILDTPRGLNAQQVHEWVTEKMAFSSPFATVYWP